MAAFQKCYSFQQLILPSSAAGMHVNQLIREMLRQRKPYPNLYIRAVSCPESYRKLEAEMRIEAGLLTPSYG